MYKQKYKNEFEEIENHIGGLHGEKLLVIGGRPGMGKTTLALNIVSSLAFDKKLPVVVFSLELPKEMLLQRMLCSKAEVDSLRLKTGNMQSEDWERVANAMNKFSQAPIYIDDNPTCTITKLEAKCKEFAMKEKDAGLIIIDYLQLIDTEEKSRGRQIANIMRRLKKLTKEINIPIIVLSQLSKRIDDREDKRPKLTDFNKTATIAKYADVVIFIYRSNYYNTDEQYADIQDTEIIFAKNNFGKTDTIQMQLDSKIVKFREKK